MASDERAEAEIDIATGELTRLLQRHVPGLVESLYVVGSAADGDFHPGRSDLDFVSVLSRPATVDDLEALVIVHRLYGADRTFPPLDGIWVTAAELAAGPDASADGPTSHAGVFLERSRGNRNPVTWLALRQRPLTVLGDPLDVSRLWHDPERLRSWTCENVESYWTGWLDRAANPLGWPGLAMLGQAAPMWGVLGIARLHHTLATGRIASKSGAGEYALTAFDPRWRRIVAECLRIRRGVRRPLYRSPLTRRREAIDFVGMVISAIREQYCRPR